MRLIFVDITICLVHCGKRESASKQNRMKAGELRECWAQSAIKFQGMNRGGRQDVPLIPRATQKKARGSEVRKNICISYNTGIFFSCVHTYSTRYTSRKTVLVCVSKAFFNETCVWYLRRCFAIPPREISTVLKINQPDVSEPCLNDNHNNHRNTSLIAVVTVFFSTN